MAPELEAATIRALSSRHILFQALSVLSTHNAGRDHGAGELCSSEEKKFLWETVSLSLSGHELGSSDVGRLQALFARAGATPHPVLKGLHFLTESLQLLELLGSICGEQDDEHSSSP